MGTAASLRDIARRLESEVARHGCGRLACSLCQDVEDAMLPPAAPTPRPWLIPAFRVLPERPSSRPVATRRTGEHLAIPEAIARQDAAFGCELACY